jgi:hypothetical protein
MNSTHYLDYKCIACNIDLYNPLNLNKHLYICLEYKNFIKNYIPPKTIKCDKCNLEFTEKNFENHKLNCIKKIFI